MGKMEKWWKERRKLREIERMEEIERNLDKENGEILGQ